MAFEDYGGFNPLAGFEGIDPETFGAQKTLAQPVVKGGKSMMKDLLSSLLIGVVGSAGSEDVATGFARGWHEQMAQEQLARQQAMEEKKMAMQMRLYETQNAQALTNIMAQRQQIDAFPEEQQRKFQQYDLQEEVARKQLGQVLAEVPYSDEGVKEGFRIMKESGANFNARPTFGEPGKIRIWQKDPEQYLQKEEVVEYEDLNGEMVRRVFPAGSPVDKWERELDHARDVSIKVYEAQNRLKEQQISSAATRYSADRQLEATQYATDNRQSNNEYERLPEDIKATLKGLDDQINDTAAQAKSLTDKKFGGLEQQMGLDQLRPLPIDPATGEPMTTDPKTGKPIVQTSGRQELESNLKALEERNKKLQMKRNFVQSVIQNGPPKANTPLPDGSVVIKATGPRTMIVQMPNGRFAEVDAITDQVLRWIEGTDYRPIDSRR